MYISHIYYREQVRSVTGLLHHADLNRNLFTVHTIACPVRQHCGRCLSARSAMVRATVSARNSIRCCAVSYRAVLHDGVAASTNQPQHLPSKWERSAERGVTCLANACAYCAPASEIPGTQSSASRSRRALSYHSITLSRPRQSTPVPSFIMRVS